MANARKEFTGNAAQTTLSSSMSAGAPAAGQTFSVVTGGGTNYPTGAYSGGFVLSIDRGTANEEKILCSARSGDTFTVATSGRGWDGTTAQSHGGGVTTGTVDLVIDADTMTDVSAHMYDTTRNDHTQYQKAPTAAATAGQVMVENDAASAALWQETPPLLAFKQAVRAATTANGTLATAYANGQTVDGVVLATGDRILLKNQTTGSENGLYTVNAAGAPTRATDFDAAVKCKPGSLVLVQEGTTNAGTAWRLSNTGTVTPGTTAMTWAQFAAAASVTGDSDQIVIPTQMFS